MVAEPGGTPHQLVLGYPSAELAFLDCRMLRWVISVCAPAGRHGTYAVDGSVFGNGGFNVVRQQSARSMLASSLCGHAKASYNLT